ncbi:hypothetical protein F2P56_021641 [Juglans regia]|uniref:U-box domain-containing protein n=1 Tax=Juglans regia TaxID=51240 RepID=A0A833USV5_JUGRE|nr:hypothetical protein F2P56_021641 [Juglans regia]
MILSWRRLRASRGGNKISELLDGNLQTEITIPTYFRCPISLDLMRDPVTLSTGITYDRENIEKWIEAGNQTCPVSNQVLMSFDQIPNHAIRKMIQDWCVQNRSNGIERIPTPRIPVTQYEVSQICSRIAVSTKRGDHKSCRELVGCGESLKDKATELLKLLNIRRIGLDCVDSSMDFKYLKRPF